MQRERREVKPALYGRRCLCDSGVRHRLTESFCIIGAAIMTDWPGLSNSNLYEGRDLYPTIDVRSLFKGILAEHLLLPDNYNSS